MTVVDRVDPGGRSVVNPRIVFAPGAAAMSAGALRIVLTHELFHYAARADTAMGCAALAHRKAWPISLPGHRALPADAASAASSLPSDQDLDTPGPRRSLAYDRAWWFARFVRRRLRAAEAARRALYAAACGVGHSDLPAAFRVVLGVDSAGRGRLAAMAGEPGLNWNVAVKGLGLMAGFSSAATAARIVARLGLDGLASPRAATAARIVAASGLMPGGPWRDRSAHRRHANVTW